MSGVYPRLQSRVGLTSVFLARSPRPRTQFSFALIFSACGSFDVHRIASFLIIRAAVSHPLSCCALDSRFRTPITCLRKQHPQTRARQRLWMTRLLLRSSASGLGGCQSAVLNAGGTFLIPIFQPAVVANVSSGSQVEAPLR